MRLVAACALLAMASSALAEQQMQFDLKCTGTSKTESQKLDAPFQRTIHVDLVTGQYCNDECGSVRKIAQVDPLRIAFEWSPAEPMLMNRVAVDRRTGDYTIGQLNVEPGHWLLGKAVCTPAPFTPFPTTKF
jgi:hypothetical protein